MAQAGAGNMDIEAQKGMFHGFLVASVWGSGLIAQSVALLTLAFAIGMGWWMGLLAFAVIGVGVGLVFRMSSAYWVVQITLWVLMAIGGAIVPAVAGLAG